MLDELSDPDGVCEGVKDDVPVPLPVLVAVGVTERLVVDVVLPVPVSDPVELGLAPRVTLAVGVRDTERDRESVDVAVSLDVGVALDVAVPVGETDAPFDVDGVALALAPTLKDEVGVSVTMLETLPPENPTLLDVVTVGVTVSDSIGELVNDAV